MLEKRFRDTDSAICRVAGGGRGNCPPEDLKIEVLGNTRISGILRPSQRVIKSHLSFKIQGTLPNPPEIPHPSTSSPAAI